MIAEIVKWSIVGWLVFGGLVSITQVGKPRKPLTSGTAAVIVAVAAIEVVLIVVFWEAS